MINYLIFFFHCFHLFLMKKQDTFINITTCEIFLKSYYNISESEPLIIYDVYDMTNNKYKYKVFSIDGRVLNTSLCQDDNIICRTNEYLSNNRCIKCPPRCSKCSNESVEQNLCIKCNNHKKYFEKYELDDNVFLNCIKEANKPYKYFFNENLLRYEPCYQTCEDCSNYGNDKNNSCITCIYGYLFREEKPNNCVVDCKYFYYYNNISQYRCTKFNVCPAQMYLIKNKKKCVFECDKESPYKYEFRGECIKKCPQYTTLDKNTNKCIYEEKCNLIKSYLEIDKNELINENGQIINELAKIYATNCQSEDCKDFYNYNNKDYNLVIYKKEECLDFLLEQQEIEITRLNFKECYKLLRKKYGINNFVIIVIDLYKQSQLPYTYYSFYHPVTGDLLNSKICSNTSIEKIINLLNLKTDNYEIKKTLLSQGIDIFNSSSPFFTNICFNFDYPKRKDITLNQRTLLLYDNIQLCDNGCNTKGINFTNYQAICECSSSSNNLDNGLIDNFISEKIIEILRTTNIEVLKCYKDVFEYEHFKKNYGSITILVLIFIQTIFILIYYLKDSFEMKRYTFGLIYAFINYINDKTSKNNIINNNQIKKDVNIDYKKEIKIGNQKSDDSRNNSVLFNYYFHDYSDYSNEQNSQIKIFSRGNNDNISPKYRISNNELKQFLKKSPNEMEYDEAIKYDRRNFIDMFKDYLFDNLILLNIFFEDDKYKPRSFKVIIYILIVDLYFVINGLFYSESYIEELYFLEEEENFWSFVPRNIERIVYTSIIGGTMNVIIEFLIVSGNSIKKLLKKTKSIKPIIEGEISNISFKINKSIIIFININIIIMLFSWYYISCFNNVYPYIKIEWIKSSVFIYLLNEITSLAYIFGFALLKYISIRCKSEKLFNLTEKLS